MEKESGISKKADEFLQIFKRGEEFTKDLIKENEERIRLLEDEINSLMERYKKTEEENKDFASKYVEVESENNMLANLYVASYQLHSTLDFNEVLRIVIEIIINLVGAEKFALFMM